MHRYMFVGDSMTIGSAGDFTWRYRMWQHLEATAGPGGYEIVGPRTELHEGGTAYAADDFPADARRHLAGWGEGWLHMAPLIAGAVAGHRPDILLISLGLIDLGFYTDATGTIENVRRFVTEVRTANPRVRAVLLPVIPNIRAEHDALFAAEVAHFNELLAKTVESLDTPHSPLVLTPRPDEYDIHADTYDGTHPNASGERKLAAAFATALTPALIPAPAPALFPT